MTVARKTDTWYNEGSSFKSKAAFSLCFSLRFIMDFSLQYKPVFFSQSANIVLPAKVFAIFLFSLVFLYQ